MKASSLPTELEYTGYPATSFVADGGRVFRGELGDTPIDIKSWKAPPHIVLANMSLEPRALEAFSRKYGILGEVKLDYSDRYRVSSGKLESTPEELLHSGIAELVTQRFITTSSEFEGAQSLLRLAWLGDRSNLRVLRESIERDDFQVVLTAESNAIPIILTTHDIWPYTCLSFILDYRAGRVRKCAYPECTVTPYFICQRKDQEFCCHACAVSATNARRVTRKAR